jgi:AcrR family transcriptional regulator
MDEHVPTGDTPLPSQRAQRKAETRRRLLEAATDVFIESGPTTASLDVIAARAGVSRPTLFFHFGSRTEMLDALVLHLLEQFRSEARHFAAKDFPSFLEAYLRAQRRPTVRLVWQLGDLLYPDHSDGPNAGYWDLVAEIELRLSTAGLDPSEAYERALVLAPALMMVARRAAQDLATENEIKNFVSAASRWAPRASGLPLRSATPRRTPQGDHRGHAGQHESSKTVSGAPTRRVRRAPRGERDAPDL